MNEWEAMWAAYDEESYAQTLSFVPPGAALDQAVWDLAAQREGVSLAALLARPYAEGARARVQVGKG